MVSTMKISLNVAALEALFPEGSENRVELAQAVIQEFANRHIKLGATETLKNSMSPIYKQVSDELKKDLLEHLNVNTLSYNPTILSIKNGSGLQKAIYNSVANYLDEQIRAMIDELIQTAFKEVTTPEIIERMVKIAVNAKVNEATKSLVEQEVARQVKAKLASIMSNLN